MFGFFKESSEKKRVEKEVIKLALEAIDNENLLLLEIGEVLKIDIKDNLNFDYNMYNQKYAKKFIQQPLILECDFQLQKIASLMQHLKMNNIIINSQGKTVNSILKGYQISMYKKSSSFFTINAVLNSREEWITGSIVNIKKHYSTND